MLNEDQLKITQRALDYLMANADLTRSQRLSAQSAYEKLEAFMDGDVIADAWHIEDVFSVMFPDEAEEDDPRDRTEEEIETARAVLKAALDNHDATIGINWDVLEYYLDVVKEAA